MRLGLTTREVARRTRDIAVAQQNQDYIVSHARLVQVENDGSIPGIFKCFSLSAIYGVPIDEIISYYLDIEAPPRLNLAMALPGTRLLATGLPPGTGSALPDVPAGALEYLAGRNLRCAVIGMSDYTMYPLLRPGSIVQIDEDQRLARTVPYRSEFDRPIYLIESRRGYLCSWVEIEHQRLRAIPHPLSPCQTRDFAYPSEAEIIGRVVGVSLRLIEATSGANTEGNPPDRRERPAKDIDKPKTTVARCRTGSHSTGGKE
jgi:transcriptional regulator with XRE-family HTH domain